MLSALAIFAKLSARLIDSQRIASQKSNEPPYETISDGGFFVRTPSRRSSVLRNSSRFARAFYVRARYRGIIKEPYKAAIQPTNEQTVWRSRSSTNRFELTYFRTAKEQYVSFVNSVFFVVTILSRSPFLS